MDILKVKDSTTGQWSDIPAIIGPPGPPGPNGVYVGPSAPTDPDVNVWLDTDEPGQTVVTSVNGMSGAVTIPTFTVYTHTFETASITSGTPGTRATQLSISNPYPDKTLVGVAITYVSGSSGFSPLVFQSGSTLYCNFYRASGASVGNPAVTANFVFMD